MCTQYQARLAICIVSRLRLVLEYVRTARTAPRAVGVVQVAAHHRPHAAHTLGDVAPLVECITGVARHSLFGVKRKRAALVNSRAAVAIASIPGVRDLVIGIERVRGQLGRWTCPPELGGSLAA